ncbi:MAG: hypothetical protein Q4C70_04965 [Planctomycetia bacterium]|nr:hypothetical protein [Planctomycetia bacterium]
MEQKFQQVEGRISMTFDNTPFPLAMTEISNQTGVSIVWGKDADNTYISGTFTETDVNALLLAIARRYEMGLSDFDGVLFMGKPSQADFYSFVLRVPFNDKNLLAPLQACLSETGKIEVFGTCYVVSDYVYNIKKVVSVVSSLREKMGRSYVAEVFFIRMRNSQLIDIQAELATEGVDLFSCSWNLDTLFSAYLTVDGGLSETRILNTPRLYLSEGRSATLSVGTELTRSRSSVSAEGYSTVSGYDKFTDGVEITLCPARVSSDVISVDVNLSVSRFDEGSGSEVPKNSKSSIISPGVLVTDGSVYFLGSLDVSEKSRAFRLFGVTDSIIDEVVTIWLKIRELSLKSTGGT